MSLNLDIKKINEDWKNLCAKIQADFDSDEPDVKVFLFLIVNFIENGETLGC